MTSADLHIEIDGVELTQLTAVGTIPGVVPLLVAAQNGPGIGTLQSYRDGTLLAWQAPGSTAFGPAVQAAVDGTYTLCDGLDPDKWIRVAVYRSFLQPGSQAAVALAERFANGVAPADATAAQAAAGNVTLYSLQLHNTAAAAMVNLSVWLDAASDPLTAISLDGAAWSSPHDQGSGLAVGTIAAGASVTLYCRRTLPANQPASPKIRVFLHVAFDGD